MRTIRWIALHLGRGPARSLLWPITGYFLLKARPQRAISRRFLARVTGRRAGWSDVARHYHCFASTILDRVYLLSGRHGQLDVCIRGEELVTERVAARRGFLLIGAHLGSFEILRALGVEREGIPLKILMHSAHNRVITGLLDALNPRIAQTVIPLGEANTLLAVKEALDSGHAVGLLGDRFGPGESWTTCRFFDGEARFPTGPLALAAVAQVPVLLFFGLYRGGNRYDLHFELFAERVDAPGGKRGAALGPYVQIYADRLAHYTRIAPYNWFNFYDFWTKPKTL